MKIIEIKQKHQNSINEGIDTYLSFLEKENWGRYTDAINQFPKMNLEYQSPSLVTHTILELSSLKKQQNLLNKVILELEQTTCTYLSISTSDTCTEKEIFYIAERVEESSIMSVEIKFKFDNNLLDIKEFEENIKTIMHDNKKIREIEIYEAPYDKIIKTKNKSTSILYNKNRLESCNIKNTSFFINQSFFIEAKNRNSCLNGKICIDKNGNIKNCLMIDKIYGNINQSHLNDILKNTDFCKIWEITKDNINTCQDCIYRYACQDCRAFIEDPCNVYSKPNFCTYDPNKE